MGDSRDTEVGIGACNPLKIHSPSSCIPELGSIFSGRPVIIGDLEKSFVCYGCSQGLLRDPPTQHSQTRENLGGGGSLDKKMSFSELHKAPSPVVPGLSVGDVWDILGVWVKLAFGVWDELQRMIDFIFRGYFPLPHLFPENPGHCSLP